MKLIKAEFASKGVAGSGLGLGIAGTALGLLNNGGGVLGGLFGSNNQATISALQAENYSDKTAKEVYMQSLTDNRRLTQAKFGCIDGTIANMMGTIGKITDTVVPMSASCPTPMAKYNSWAAPTNTPATGA